MLKKLFVSSFDKDERIWSGISCNTPYNSDATIGEVVLNMLSMMPEKIVQINDSTSRKLTAADFSLMSIRTSQNLERLGYKQGDVIGFVAKDNDFVAPFIFGAFLNGIIINPIAPYFDKDEIIHIFSVTKPRAIFYDLNVHHIVTKAVEALPWTISVFLMNDDIGTNPSIQEFLKPTGKEKCFLPPQLAKNDDYIAAILYTSGSEGSPKGVTITHRSLLMSCSNSYPCTEVLFTCANFDWVSGLILQVMSALRCCTKIITEQSFTPEHLLYLIEKYRISGLFTPPAQMALTSQAEDIRKKDLSSLKSYISGGSSLPQNVADRIKKYAKNVQIVRSYALTELGATISMGFDSGTSVGQVSPNMKVKIIDDDGNKLGIGETGEICAKPLFKLYGFYGNVEETKKILDCNGWLRTGDLGYFNQHGSLHICDRKKEIFKYKLYYMSPTEIELVIMNIPDIVECCVFNIPDLIYNNLVAAAIVKKTGSSLSANDVHNHIAENLKDQHKLRGGVFFVASLPKTSTGKIPRNKVKNIFVKE